MARHRNVRGYNYDEDFEDDDLYGQSVEDDYCISPSTAAQFIYSRRDNPSGFAETLEEEYGYEDTEQSNYSISNHQLTGTEKANLDSCLDRVKEVLGDSVPEKVMIEAVLNAKFDVQQTLDSLLLQNNKQNMKTKNEETVIGGKSTKGLFCSETFSDVNNLINSLENTSDSASSCFGLGGPTVKFESPFNPSASSDTIFFRPKCANIPSVKKRTLNSSCKSLGALSLPFSDSDDEKSFYKPVNKEVTLPIKSNTNATRSCGERDACFSLAAELLKGNPSEKSSWDHSELKGVQDLKVLLNLSETGDSSDAQDNALIVFQKNSEHDSKGCLDSPSGLVNAFGNLMVDNKMNQKLSKKTELSGNIPSFFQDKGRFPGNNSCSSAVDNSTSGNIPSFFQDKGRFPGNNSCSSAVDNSTLAESPSLADLLQEHQENNRNKDCSLSGHCNQSSAEFADTELGLPSLSQLASQPQPSSGMTELSGSLSSLTFFRSSPVKDLENLSLSDLIAKSIELDKPTSTCSHSEFHVAKTLPPAVLNSDIDLSVLIRKSALSPEPVEVHKNNLFPEMEYLFSKQRQQLFVAKGSKKSKKRLRSRFSEGAVSWTKGLSARPSAFAVTLCLRYPPKRCKRQTVNLHKAFSYNRQMQEVKINEIGPLLAIAPFDFKSPSPDDIVKSGQKKAFAR